MPQFDDSLGASPAEKPLMAALDIASTAATAFRCGDYVESAAQYDKCWRVILNEAGPSLGISCAVNAAAAFIKAEKIESAVEIVRALESKEKELQVMAGPEPTRCHIKLASVLISLGEIEKG